MDYFDDIQIGDKVWSIEHGWGEVDEIYDNKFVVYFGGLTGARVYDYNGHDFYHSQINQTLFWDEIKFEKPKKPKIKLKEDYSECINKNYFHVNNSIEQLIRFAKLLSLRDQECKNSKRYVYRGKENYAYTISSFVYDKKHNRFEEFQPIKTHEFMPDKVFFKTKEDAQKICDILNSGRFEL